MNTTVKFCWHRYGNAQDNYYVDDYEALRAYLGENFVFSSKVNLGITNGVIIINTFRGNFNAVNCAVVEHEWLGTHLYKITKKEFIRKDMWRITMIKDVISSNYNAIRMSDVLVSRLGVDRTKFDPLLLIDEEMKLNQVKKNQMRLLEKRGLFSYGYVAFWKKGSLDGTIKWNATSINSDNYDISVAGIGTLPYYNKDITYNRKSYLEVSATQFLNINSKVYRYNFNMENGGVLVNGRKVISVAQYLDTFYYVIDSDTITQLNPTLAQSLIEAYQYTGYFNSDVFELDGKVVFDSITNLFYELKVRDINPLSKQRLISEEEFKSLTGSSYAEHDAAFKGANALSTIDSRVRIDFINLPNKAIPEQNLGTMEDMNDQPLQAFFIPMVENVDVYVDGVEKTLNKEFVEKMLYDLMATYSGENGKLIDVQLVPYSPIEGLYSSFNIVSGQLNLLSSKMKKLIDVDDYIIPIYEVQYATFTRSIGMSAPLTDYKISMVKKYILTSPSGATNYEFSVAKNGGLSGGIVDVDLRPYASYYRLRPLYKGLYGGNFKDTRGLIWKEDTSLTQTSSAWETYKRQNINYLNSFNADVDFKRSQLALQHEANWGNFGFDSGKRMIQAGIDAAGVVANGVGDAVFSMGASVAASGGAAGAVIGGGALMEGLEAGQLGYNNMMENKLLSNEIAYSKKQFNMALDNIRALPENVEKVSGVYSTNNYVPILQMFEPTEQEIEWYTKYLDLNGVNVGLVIDLTNYEFDYLQGSMIKYRGIITNEEYVEIVSSLSRGVRKYKEEA